MANGFMGKVLRVNLTNGSITEEALSEGKMRKFLGGATSMTKFPPG